MPDNEMKKGVLTIVERDLLTPRGLRTLSPQNENYKGFMKGTRNNGIRHIIRAPFGHGCWNITVKAISASIKKVVFIKLRKC